MDNRERINRTIRCQRADRVPFVFPFGPWAETMERWKSEGLAGDDWLQDVDADAGWEFVAGVSLGYSPAFDVEILEESGGKRIFRDALGIVQECIVGHSTIPNYLSYPVANRDDWHKLVRERLDPLDPRRLVEAWLQQNQDALDHKAALQLGWFPYGLFGTLRDMMGLDALMFAFYDQPELVGEMMDYLTGFWLAIYEQVCSRVQVDCIHMWEDMSGKQGPLISPSMIRKYMLPNYRRIRDFCDRHGVTAFSVDTDGNCSQLIPLFLDAGVNLLYPFEVAAGSDVVAIKRQYPSDLCVMGGIDKRALAGSTADIDRELQRIAPALDIPGYIPGLDHLYHPEISYSNFLYFARRLQQMVGKP